MPVRTVTSRASLQSGVFTREYTVKNAGDNTVYLGQDSSLTVPSRAFSLPPGSTLVWRGETELWAICNAGEDSELEVLYDATSAFTPGPDKVTATIAGPVTVEGNVGIDGEVTVTGDVGIDGPVTVSGDINVTNSEIDVIGAVFTKPSAQPVIIGSTTVNLIASDTLVTFSLGNYDLSAYSSVLVIVEGYEAFVAADYRDRVEFVINQGDAVSAFVTRKNAVFLLRSAGQGQANFQVPILTNQLNVQGAVYKRAGSAAGSVRITVLASHEVITVDRYAQSGAGMAGDLATGGSYTVALSSAGTVSEYLAIVAGPAMLNIGNLNTTTINANCLVYVYKDAVSGMVRLTSGFIPAGFNDTEQRQMFLPARPIRIDTTCGASSGITVAVNN